MNRNEAIELLRRGGISRRHAVEMVNEAERLSESITRDSLKVRCDQAAALDEPEFEVVTFQPCRFGTRVSTCYHTPRCRWVWGYGEGQPFGRFVPVTDPAGTDCLSEHTVAGGVCTLCENEASELVPWGTAERLCWGCTDLQIDLLAKAVAEGYDVEVMVAR